MKTVWARVVAMEDKEKWIGLKSVSETTRLNIRPNMGQEEVKEGKRITNGYCVVFGLNNLVNGSVVYQERLREQLSCMRESKALF